MSETNCVTHHEACACREESHRTEIARLAARVVYLEQENARLTSDLIRREGELEAESRREK